MHETIPYKNNIEQVDLCYNLVYAMVSDKCRKHKRFDCRLFFAVQVVLVVENLGKGEFSSFHSTAKNEAACKYTLVEGSSRKHNEVANAIANKAQSFTPT